jgi:AraC-like DNA-binding protein
MQDEYASPLTLQYLSTVAGLTPSHLVRVFNHHYGMTPHAYLLNQRIRHARALLVQGHPLVEVALATGFSDQAHFQRQFKRLVAATPGQYQSLPQRSSTR